MTKKSLLGTMTFGLLAVSLALGGCGQSTAEKVEEAISGEDAGVTALSADAAQSTVTTVTATEITQALEGQGLACTEESVDVQDITSAWACGDGETQLLVREFTEPDLATEYARDTLTVDACAADGVKEFRWIMGGPAWIIYSENPEETQKELLDTVRDDLKFEDHREVC